VALIRFSTQPTCLLPPCLFIHAAIGYRSTWNFCETWLFILVAYKRICEVTFVKFSHIPKNILNHNLSLYSRCICTFIYLSTLSVDRMVGWSGNNESEITWSETVMFWHLLVGIERRKKVSGWLVSGPRFELLTSRKRCRRETL